MSLEKNLETNTQALLRSIAVMEKLLTLLAEGLPTPPPPTPPAPAAVMSLKSNKMKNKKLKSLDANPKTTTPHTTTPKTTTYSVSDARAALLHIAKADGQETAKAVLERIAGVSVLPKAEAGRFADLIEHAVNEYQYELSA